MSSGSRRGTSGRARSGRLSRSTAPRRVSPACGRRAGSSRRPGASTRRTGSTWSRSRGSSTLAVAVIGLAAGRHLRVLARHDARDSRLVRRRLLAAGGARQGGRRRSRRAGRPVAERDLRGCSAAPRLGHARGDPVRPRVPGRAPRADPPGRDPRRRRRVDRDRRDHLLVPAPDRLVVGRHSGDRPREQGRSATGSRAAGSSSRATAGRFWERFSSSSSCSPGSRSWSACCSSR